ncbi:MAG: tRNA dihydrouridine synthase DusB [Erysipelotrichaceae bacterium]|nr:tRNA dihydrouridine synthase DusB [Erysipelotrichaceae bacterium]
MSSLHIGNVTLDNRIIVGPMAGISNPSFRAIAVRFGAALIYSEMISDKAIVFKNRKTIKMTEVLEEERPLSLQLFGSDPETMVQAARYMDKNTNCDIIDINMGCPVRKVVNTGAGSAMMKDPQRSFEIVKAIVENVDKPVTVKMRSGWDEQHINVLEVAKLMEQAGVAAVAVHPRTRTQFYSGRSDWSLIRDVKMALQIPVIGNGDIRSIEDIAQMEKETGCDFFMIARGCLGNPWLISQAVRFDRYGEITEAPDYNERLDQCLDHARSLLEAKGEKTAIKEMRAHACWYVSTLPNANRCKAKINFMNTMADLEKIMSEYRNAISSGDFVYFMEDDRI